MLPKDFESDCLVSNECDRIDMVEFGTKKGFS